MKLNPINVAVAAAIAAIGMPALAQQAGNQLERVEVTGSRILSVNAVSPAPVQVMSAADIAASGASNLQDLLLKSPVFGTPGVSRTNSNFATTGSGQATVDLRNFGAQRTLVLVNGHRFVSGQPGASAVDLNAIPTDFIERVEVLTGGASASYGSEAVAGVVNIILKRNFEGLTLDAKIGQSSHSDNKEKKLTATWGVNAAGGKSHLMTHFSVSKEGAVYSRDREASAIDQFSEGVNFTGDPADMFKAHRTFYSSFAPQGRFFYDAKNSYTYDASGKEIGWNTNGPAGDGVGATGFNRSAYRTIAVPVDRYLLASKGEHQLNDSHTVFFEGTYSASKTKSELEPFPLNSNQIYGNGQGAGRVPAEFMVGGVKLRNPMVPDYLYNKAVDTDGDGLKDYSFTRRLSDVGNRGAVANRDTFRVVTGLKGDLTSVWNYDAYVGYGITKENQKSNGQVNTLNFRNALESVVDVNDVNANGSKTDAVCRDAIARLQGCVPINIFGLNSMTPDMLKYIAADSSYSSKAVQSYLGFSVSGEPFEAPAGPVGFAFGGEYRRESSETLFDALTQAGLNAGNALPNTSGSYDVKEVYGEVKLPLLKDKPLIKSLDATAAIRGGKYSTVGNVTSWNAGLDWAANSTFRLRATSSVSTRAPNVSELYQPPAQTFPTGLVDPCAGVTLTTTGTKAVNCRAEPAVLANITANGKFTQTQADTQGVSGYDLGNPNLKSEAGKSKTLGLVITPKSVPLLRNMTFTADYYDITISDAIATPGRQFTLDQCYQGDTKFCKFIKRRQTGGGVNNIGTLSYIDQFAENSGGAAQKGVDLTATWADKLGPGRMSARLAYTYLINAYSIAQPGADRDQSQDEIGSSRNRWNLNVNYDYGNWGFQTTTTYIGKAYLNDQFLSSNFDLSPETKQFAKVGAQVYFDFQTTYTMGKTQFYFGMKNAFDTKAPPIISGLPGNTTGAETDAGTYDAIGRRYYLGVRISL